MHKMFQLGREPKENECTKVAPLKKLNLKGPRRWGTLKRKGTTNRDAEQWSSQKKPKIWEKRRTFEQDKSMPNCQAMTVERNRGRGPYEHSHANQKCDAAKEGKASERRKEKKLIERQGKEGNKNKTKKIYIYILRERLSEREKSTGSLSGANFQRRRQETQIWWPWTRSKTRGCEKIEIVCVWWAAVSVTAKEHSKTKAQKPRATHRKT